jgi:hypothetical protein
MSKFFKEVATPETRGRQTVAPSGPSVDANARQEAANNTGGLGGAIQSLIGIANAGSNAVDKHNEEELKAMSDEFKIDSMAITEGAATSMHRDLEVFASEKEKKVFDLSDDEIAQATQTSISEQLGNYGDIKYKPLAQKMLEEKRGKYLQFISKKNKQDKFSDKTGKLGKSTVKELFNINSDNAAIFPKEFEKIIAEASLGIDSSEPEIARAVIGSMVQEVINTDNAKALEVIKHPDFLKLLKDKYDMEDTRPLINSLEQKMVPVITKQRKLNESKTTDGAYSIMDSGGGSIKGINDYISERREFFNRSDNKVYAPSPKYWVKLKGDLLKLQESTLDYDSLGEKVMSGEHTAIVSSAKHTEKQKREATERLMFKQSSVDTSNMEDVLLDIMGGEEKGERLATAINNGVPITESLVDLFRTPVVNSRDPNRPFGNLEDQNNAFIKLNADTGGKLLSAVGAKSYNRIMQQDHILGMINAGVLTKTDGEAQLADIAVNQNKSTSLLNGYKSEEGMLAMAEDEDIEKDFRNTSSNARTFTWDETKNQDQVYTFMSSTFNHFKKTGMETERAIKLTNEVTKEEYRKIENPDGSEVSLPKEFKGFDWDKVFLAAKQTKGLKEKYAAMNFLNKEWTGDLNVHVPRKYDTKKQVIIRLGQKDIFTLDADAVNKMLKAYEVSDRQSRLDNFSLDLESKRARSDERREDFTKNLGK